MNNAIGLWHVVVHLIEWIMLFAIAFSLVKHRDMIDAFDKWATEIDRYLDRVFGKDDPNTENTIDNEQPSLKRDRRDH